MKAKFIGDPRDGFSGPEVMSMHGVLFPKGEMVQVHAAVFRKLSMHSHFETDGADVDHSAPALTDEEIENRAKSLGVKVDGRWGDDKRRQAIIDHASSLDLAIEAGWDETRILDEIEAHG